MAYSCVKVLFEIGHEASIRTKRTPEGFTHDWEVYVRGSDNTEINHFVDKVVFYLHETFTKPKRVIKEPPYSVKESGYAGFNLPIDVYFRTDEEPKKVRFKYDLNLQTSGPSIKKFQREEYVFRNPDEDLRRRLIRGGGVGVGSDAGSHLSGEKPSPTSAISSSTDETSAAKSSTPQLVGKPKLGGDPIKKHKVKEHRSEEPRVSNPFQDLFGTPIKTVKVSPDPKKPSPSPKVSPLPKPPKPPDKSSNDKSLTVPKPSKHNVQKDSKESSSSSSSKEEKKEKNKERDKSKEKIKHPTTPPKHPSSPPKIPPPPPPKPNKDETKKPQNEEHKVKSDSKSPGESSKSEKKKKDKRNKEEKSSKKERHKDKEHESKSSDKIDKGEKSSKEPKEKEKEKDKEKEKEKDKDKDKEIIRKPEKDISKEVEKPKEREKSINEGDRERSRHKHKKKERSKRDESVKDKEKDREKSIKKNSSDSKKSESKDRDKNGVPSESSKKRPRSPSHSPRSASSPKPSPIPEKLPPPPPAKDKPTKRPLNALFDELAQDSSDSNLSQLSGDEDLIEHSSTQLSKPSAPLDSNKVEITNKSEIQNDQVTTSNSTQANNKLEPVKSKPESANQERYSLTKVSSNSVSGNSSKQKDKSASKKNKEKKDSSSGVGKNESGSKGEKESSKKRKRKSSGKVKEEESSVSGRGDDAPPSKLQKLDPETNKSDDQVGQISGATSSHAELNITAELTEDGRTRNLFIIPPAASPPSTTANAGGQFSPDYVSQLKDLQRKIMTLEDNTELQRVVQVIAETGQYEITKKTFDFDLCALDRSTVKRLQDFFTTS